MPPFEKWPMHFLRKVLSGEKSVWSFLWIFMQMLKQEEIAELQIPQYKELSVKSVWPLVKDVADLMKYFPDYKESQYPWRTHMFSILSTLRHEDVMNMILNARKNRSLDNQEDDDELVFINKRLYEEIEGVMSQKRK